jgi:hypothetical protein
MKRSLLCLSFCIAPVAVGSATTSAEGLLTLAPGDVAEVRPARGVTREQFFEDWGQFEVRIPKERFPIPAPHCRKDVILRMPAVPPRASARAQQLEYRWNLFQALLALNEEKGAKVELPLASGPYIVRGSTGARELKYCNAYVDGKALKAGQVP